MSKFHINKHGIPAPCKATKGNCPYGGSTGSENHYDSMEEAQKVVNKLNEKKYGILPGEDINKKIIKTEDGATLKKGDIVFRFVDNNHEFLYADAEEADEAANMSSDDSDFYERYAEAVGMSDKPEIEEIVLDEEMIASINGVSYKSEDTIS